MSRAQPRWQLILEEKLRLLPPRPGVYLLKDGRGKVLYIGKAKRLPARVRSYFRSPAPDDPRLSRLRASIRDLDYIVTASEAEALVLEANLIKSQAPFYNIELKDDKKYPFLKINVPHEYPRLTVTRTIVADGSRYFGPYTRVRDLRQLLRSVQRLFPLRSCRDRRLKRDERECLKYSLDLCPAPCTGRADREQYRRTVDQLVGFLAGRDTGVIAEFEKSMRRMAADLRFEESAQLRDDLQRLALLREPQRMTDLARPDLDIVALAARGNRAVAAVFSHREGKIVGTRRMTIGQARQAAGPEILGTILTEHYQGRGDIPALLLCNLLPADHRLIERWLAERAGHRVRILCPRRGARRALVKAAEENAALALEEIELIEQGKRERLEQSAYILQEALGLDCAPVRIEGYDISNIQGRQAVGSQVLFCNGRPLKSGYRRYRIKTVAGADDFAMLAEVLGRRLRRLSEKPGEEPPDLLLIDGGKGQVARAAQVLRDGGHAHLPVVGLAKRREELFLPASRAPIALAASSPGLQLLQRVRDEAHRFAVTYHRELRSRSMIEGPLSGIAGLGPRRRAALMTHFGGLGKLSQASEEHLRAVPGIGPDLARRIRRAISRRGRPRG